MGVTVGMGIVFNSSLAVLATLWCPWYEYIPSDTIILNSITMVYVPRAKWWPMGLVAVYSGLYVFGLIETLTL